MFERLRSDFGKATDRCFQIKDRDVPGDQAGTDAWTALTSRIQHDVFTVFDARCVDKEWVSLSYGCLPDRVSMLDAKLKGQFAPKHFYTGSATDDHVRDYVVAKVRRADII